MIPWLFAAGVANLAVTPLYAYVGTRLYERPVPARARLPSAQFAVWWWGLGGTGVLSGLEAILYSVGALGFVGMFTLYLLTILADCVLLWGLVGYLLYIYTGKYHLLELTAFYAAFYVTVLYWVIASGPSGVALAGGLPALTESHPLGGPILIAVVIGLIFPELIGILLYVSLVRRAQDRTLRYRILMVSAALGLYFVGGSFDPFTGVAAQEWALVRALIEAASAALALFAYFPPETVRRAFRVSSVAREESHADAVPTSP